MAQIIKHRRGSLEALSAVTASLQKGELVIASGSSNLSVTNGASIVFAVAENAQVQAVNRVLVGDNAPNTFAAGTYNGMLKGVPYYASGSSTLYLLGEGANDIPDLTGNISNFSSSVAESINALSSSIGSGAIGTSVSLLNSFTASQLTQNATLATYTGSVDTRLTEIGVVSGSLISSASAAAVANANQNLFTASAETRFTEIGVVSGSLISSASAAKTTNDAQDVSITNINSFTASVETKLTEIGVVSGSLISSASAAAISNANLNSFSGSQLTQNSALATITGSLISTASNHEQRLDAMEAESGSYARTNSGNIFNGTQVITGSLYITQDLVVYGSSSLFNVTASALDIGQNTIVLNTATPAVRFGGIAVADSGSNEGVSGSLVWDSFNNHWLYIQPSGSGEGYNSAILIAGPQHTGSLGNEVGLTSGKITLNTGENHIGDSIITQNGTTSISVNGDVVVTGSLTVGTLNATNGIVSGSSQITISETTGYGDFSGSISASIAAVVANVGSGVGVSIANLNTFSSSALTRLGELESTASNHETRIGTNESDISSIFGTLTDISIAQGVQDGRLTNLESTSASVNTSVAALNSSSASQQVSINNINTFSSSVLTQLTEIGVVSGSLISSASAASVSISNLNSFSGSQLTQNSTLATYTASVDTRLTEIGVVSGSLIASASAAKSTNDTQDGRLTNLEAKSASVDVSISNIHAFTSSFGTTFSSSVDSRLDTLEGTGTIQGVGTSNNVTFAKVTTSGDVVVGGDLVVQGNTVTLNTATLVVEDKLITLASGSTSSATSDGAGFEVAGAAANFVYQHSTTAFTSSIALIAPEVTASINLGSAAGSSKRVAFRNTNGNLDLVPTASVAGDLLQWDGTDFVMSNVIDGGSF